MKIFIIAVGILALLLLLASVLKEFALRAIIITVILGLIAGAVWLVIRFPYIFIPVYTLASLYGVYKIKNLDTDQRAKLQNHLKRLRQPFNN